MTRDLSHPGDNPGKRPSTKCLQDNKLRYPDNNSVTLTTTMTTTMTTAKTTTLTSSPTSPLAISVGYASTTGTDHAVLRVEFHIVRPGLSAGPLRVPGRRFMGARCSATVADFKSIRTPWRQDAYKSRPRCPDTFEIG